MIDVFARSLALLSLPIAHAAYAQDEVPMSSAAGLPAEIQPAGPRTGSAAQHPDPATIVNLRREYENLKRREAELAMLNGLATSETKAALERAVQQLDEVSAFDTLERWKAETMIYFRDALRSAEGLTLPPETPRGMKLALAPAVVAAGTAYYSAPDVSAAVTVTGATQRTTVLHVAEATPVSLVWVPGVGFAFVLQRFLEVYH